MFWRNRLTGPSRRLGAGVALAALLGACAGEVPIRESTIESSLPERTAAIVPGQTDRAAIRQMFGEPWLASHYWRFDLVRLSDKEVRALVAIVPLPIPVGVMSDDVRGYVLVGYDAGGRVSAFDRGVTHGENLSWRTPMSGVDTVLLNAGEIGFAVEMMKNTPSVFVSSTRRDEYLRSRRPQDQCTVLAGCLQNGCSSALIVDEGPERSLPGHLLRIHTAPDGGVSTQEKHWLAPLTLAPGRHRLEIPENMYSTFKASTEFSCRAGDVLYAAIEIKPVDEPAGGRKKMHWKAQAEGSINVSGEMPERFLEQPMLVYRGDGWLVAVEPSP